MNGAALAFGVLVVAAPASGHPDDSMCNKIAAFAEARYEPGLSMRQRWFELHWRGSWLGEQGWGFGYRSSDAPSGKLCKWLAEDSSFEFPSRLPQQILSCYGYKFPRGSNWGAWKSAINLNGSRKRLLTLEVNIADLAGEEGAIRLSAFDDGRDGALDPLDTQTPMPPL